MRRTYSLWSAGLSVSAGLLIVLSYGAAPADPEGFGKIMIQICFFGALASAVASLALSFLAWKNKERGFLKWTAPLILLGTLLVFLALFVFMVISFL
ncbi:hypothetical protein JF544_01705 [Halobacillus kuroshimensis]|uniref:Uncharacterized protein n=1 Tax=Halobacillus kuroshimensis TaxID=302481 RepID=A0ABS3DRH5_9BACI|nr:hypothetical protein [Halobacillus kuroshimensis]MBN8233935.1 hypothetical protein [Halobacillus kuroshimensis]